MKNPLAADNLSSFGLRNDVVHVKLLPGLHFVFTCHEPFDGVGTSHGFIICLWFGSLSVGEVGAMTIGGYVVVWVIVRDGGTNGALGTRVRWHGRGSKSGRSGSGRSGRCKRISGRVNSGRRVVGVGFRFENDSLLVPPFVEYNITRFNKFPCWSMH